MPIGGGECAYVGDVIVTRRNDRRLETTGGERVRNRDLWIVTATHDNGDLTVTPKAGHGQITLPVDYAREHVRLGYAATEMGTQSDTVTASLELASRATSCRNLYVAMTRGRQDNTVCVITETHDPGEARDVLDAVLAAVPATSQRRNLASQDRHLHPRCQVPDWFNTIRAHTVQQLDQAWDSYHRERHRASELEQQIADAQRQLRAVNEYARPFNEAVTDAEAALDTAKDCREALHEQLATAKRRERRILEPALAIAEQDIHTAAAARDHAVTAAQPARTLTAQADAGLRDLRKEQWRQRLYEPLFDDPDRITALQDRVAALDTWRQWANGHQLTPNRINEINAGLFVANDTIHEFFALRRTLFEDLNTAAVIHHVERGLERSPGPELSID